MKDTAAAKREQELRLLSGVLQGDKSASQRFVQHFNGLIELSVRRVFRRAGYTLGDDEIRDMVSEVWLALFDDNMHCLRRFDPARKIRVSTWLGVLSRNRAIDRLRTARERYVSLVDASDLDERAHAGPLPSEVIEKRERRRMATGALNRLKSTERRFLEAWYVESQEPEQMADEFGIAVGTVYSRRFKIQEKLAKSIARQSRRWRSGTAESRPLKLVPVH